MPASPFDSGLYRNLLADPEIGKLFTDSAEIRSMLLIEGTLAKVQGQLGLIPQDSADFIHRAAMEVQIDPAQLAAATGVNAVPVPALVNAFREAINAPEHAQHVHWGATSQDIMDTALMLRLRQVLTIWEQRLQALTDALAELARNNADLPMAARTYGQIATPTSFGAVVAAWGWPILRHRERLAQIKPRLLKVSLSGAAGTLAAMEGRGRETRAALAKALGLGDPGSGWHNCRDSLGELSGWATGVATTLGRIGEDLVLMTQSGIGEVRLGGSGGSSTMPQKQNPVAPSLLVALARHVNGLNTNMQTAGLHRQQRDGTAWFVEWLSLPQICIGLGRALVLADDLARTITPDPAAMRRGIEGGYGLIHAEAASFALARLMPRPQAQRTVKALCREAEESAVPLPRLLAERWPELRLDLSAEAQMGEAPAEARAFAAAADNAVRDPGSGATTI